MQEAEKAYLEALSIRRKLARTDPDAHLHDLAKTLNNLAYYYCITERIQEAERHADEAERILVALWQESPELYGDDMARILCTSSLISEAGENPAEPCALARRALAAAQDPKLRHGIQQIINRVCTESVAVPAAHKSQNPGPRIGIGLRLP